MILEKTIVVNNKEARYLHKASAKPSATVVFIHGFPFSADIWRNQVEVLPENIEALAYDIRGFGKSESEHSYFSIDLFARDLFSLLDQLSLSKVVLCGLSMGGYIALRAVQISPERVLGLILCDTNALADSNEQKLNRFSAIEQVLKKGKDAFATSFLKNVFAEETFRDNPSVVKFIENIILNTSASTICSALLALASRTDSSEMLNRITVPALIIRGEEDKLMSLDHAAQFSNISTSEFKSVPSSGHLPNLENTAVFNAYLNDFLEKHFSS